MVYHVSVAKPYVIATAFNATEETLDGVGIAKCCPTDKWNPYLGTRIAFNRMLSDLWDHRAMHATPGGEEHNCEVQGVNPDKFNALVQSLFEEADGL